MSTALRQGRALPRFEYSCEDARIDGARRAEALDSWLAGQLGQAWRDLRSQLLPPAALDSEPRDLWRFFLCAFELARLLEGTGAEVAFATARAWADSPPSVLPETLGGIAPLPAHPALRMALESSWRSDIHGVALVPLDREALIASHATELHDALAILASASPESWDMVRSNCAAVSFVACTPALEGQGSVSLTVKRVPGLVFVSPVPLLLLIEGIVHEAAHLWLNGVERVRTLYGDPSLRLQTPLRRDPRPVSGLLHQVWVLCHLALLHDDLARSEHPSLAAEARRIDGFRRMHREQLAAGLDALEGTPGSLTGPGLEFVTAMRRAVTPLQ